MSETSVCIFTGKCVGSAYRSIVEETRRFGDFLARLARSLRDRALCRSRRGSAAVPAAEQRPPRQDAVFRRALAGLQSADPVARQAAMRLLHKVGKEEAVALATRLLADPDEETRKQAQAALAELAPHPAE